MLGHEGPASAWRGSPRLHQRSLQGRAPGGPSGQLPGPPGCRRDLAGFSVRALHYVEGVQLLDNNGEATVDSSHSTDRSITRQADTLERIVRVLHETVGLDADLTAEVGAGHARILDERRGRAL
jgi:hypothetical protein